MAPGKSRRGTLKYTRLAGLTAMVILAGALAAGVRAQGKLGIGVCVGEPTGIAWKYRLRRRL